MKYKSIVAIVCITALLLTALIMRIDGVLLSAGIGVLAGLGGFAIGKKSSS